MTTTITKKQAQKWANTLRSGAYKQGRKALQSGDKFCCLGVACKIFIPRNKQFLDSNNELVGHIPAVQLNAPIWLRQINIDFFNKTGESLINLNDGGFGNKAPFSFDEIADLIELVYVHKALD